MGHITRRIGFLGTAAAAALLISGCTQVRSHEGYIADDILTNAIQTGVDNRQSVETSLGRPTFVGQFDKNDWYYVSRNTRQFAFRNPRPTDQQILRIRFDNAGNVTAVDKTGVELAVNISPNGDKTPTLGRDRSFFEELFGNIGTVGVPGSGGGGGGGRTQP